MGIFKKQDHSKEVFLMKRGLLMTTIGLGAAYLLRNPESRKKLMNQFQALTERSNKS